MAKLTAKVRNDLLNMLKKERRDKRCELCKELNIESKKLTAHIDPQIQAIKTKLNELEREKVRILDDAKLRSFSVGYDQCASDVLNPKLLAFDSETNELIKELLFS